MAEESRKKRLRGFAAMDAARQREIASKGGRAAHEKGTAHRFTAEEARVAGRKGGETVSRNRQHMAEIGREGGRKSLSGRTEDEENKVIGGTGVIREG
jgi:general stress protein YciG